MAHCPDPPVGVGGTPRGRSSAREQRDCPSLPPHPPPKVSPPVPLDLQSKRFPPRKTPKPVHTPGSTHQHTPTAFMPPSPPSPPFRVGQGQGEGEAGKTQPPTSVQNRESPKR